MFERIATATLVALLGVLGWLAYEVYANAKEWPAYRDAHRCVETGKWRSDTVLLPVFSGKTTVLVPTTIIANEWSCDSGTVWR